MPRPPEGEPRPNPATTFDNHVATRHKELVVLGDRFRLGLDSISDLGRVNELLLASPRPDLVMTERVAIHSVDTFDDIRRVNNFIPSMQAFGMPLFEERKSRGPDDVTHEFVGRREYTEEERAQAFFMGARGDYDAHFAFAEAHGIDRDFADDLRENLIKRESFMRMWILLPELTEELMVACLDRPGGRGYEAIDEEIFVAYSIMSRLVDKNDRGVINDDGTVDTRLLCH